MIPVAMFMNGYRIVGIILMYNHLKTVQLGYPVIVNIELYAVVAGTSIIKRSNQQAEPGTQPLKGIVRLGSAWLRIISINKTI